MSTTRIVEQAIVQQLLQRQRQRSLAARTISAIAAVAVGLLLCLCLQELVWVALGVALVVSLGLP